MIDKKDIKESNVQLLFGNASKQYSSLEEKRKIVEPIWEDCARLTLPYLSRDILTSSNTQYPTPYNSIGASVVNNLASKLSESLFPSTNSFFRLLPFEDEVKDLDEEMLQKIDTELKNTERQMLMMIDSQALKTPLTEVMKLLIVTGNSLVYKIPNGTMKVFSPYQYVVERDYVGNILKIIIEEKISITSLPKEIGEMYKDNKDIDKIEKDGVDIYTSILKINEKEFISYQETNDKIIPGTLSYHKKDFLPYIPLRWTSVINEDYGRGLTEQYLGDLRSLESLSQVMIEGADIMSRVINGVKQTSNLSLEDLNNAKNGDFIYGDLNNDITTLKIDKTPDFQIPFKLMQELEQKLSKAFLALGGNIRNSERTTATEVRAVTAELEATLGGTYSILAAELQLPLIKILLKEVKPEFVNITQPSIVTGLSAISREKDFNNIQTLISSIASLGQVMASSPQAAEAIDFASTVTAIANSLGMNSDDILNSKEQIAAKRQAEQQAQQMQAQQQAQPGGMSPQQ